MTEEEIQIAEEALGLAVPVISAWIRTLVSNGHDAAQAAAEVEALFATADAAIDLSENRKFGPRK